MVSDKERALAEQVIKLHDGKSYRLLQDMSMPPKIPDEENRITEDDYVGMCSEIDDVLGVLGSIELIDCLVRKESKLSLWKVKYSKFEDEVFWAIGYDRANLKVQDVLVQW